jgi:hypothetical protein
MREHRPKEIERICENKECGKTFMARRISSVGYTIYCKECSDKKVWIGSKGKQGKVRNFNKYT